MNVNRLRFMKSLYLLMLKFNGLTLEFINCIYWFNVLRKQKFKFEFMFKSLVCLEVFTLHKFKFFNL